MNKITPIALIVTGGLSAQAANAAIITQSFNVLPDTNGVQIKIGAGAGLGAPQYTYSHVVKPNTPLGDLSFSVFGGTSNDSMFTGVSSDSTLPTGANSFTTAAYKPGPAGDYVGLKFKIGDDFHYGVARFGTADMLSPVPLVDVIYDDNAIAAVPEPESWALLIGGLGVAGAMARRSRRREKLATA